MDGSNRAFVNLLKVAFNENLNWEKSITKPTPNNMKVIPVNFSTEHKQMLSPSSDDGIKRISLAIPSSMTKLEVALRTAYANELSLDKSRSEYNDLTDACRLACKMYEMK